MGPLPLCIGNKRVPVIGHHFIKLCEPKLLSNQTAVTAANAIVHHWLSRFRRPHSFHFNQRRIFESTLFEQLMQLLELDKTRSTPFHIQSE